MSYANRMRRDKIREFLLSHRSAGVKDLGRQLNASEATIRRDLRELAREDGYLRTRGGIALDESRAELSVQQRAHVQGWQKRSIGRKAAQLISDGEVIFLGSGSTAIEVARNLDRHRDLTVITNSLPIITMLTDNPRVSLIVAGGALRRSELSFIGHIVEKTLMELQGGQGHHGNPWHPSRAWSYQRVHAGGHRRQVPPSLRPEADHRGGQLEGGKNESLIRGRNRGHRRPGHGPGDSLEMKMELEMRGVKVVIAEQAEMET